MARPRTSLVLSVSAEVLSRHSSHRHCWQNVDSMTCQNNHVVSDEACPEAEQNLMCVDSPLLDDTLLQDRLCLPAVSEVFSHLLVHEIRKKKTAFFSLWDISGSSPALRAGLMLSTPRSSTPDGSVSSGTSSTDEDSDSSESPLSITRRKGSGSSWRVCVGSDIMCSKPSRSPTG